MTKTILKTSPLFSQYIEKSDESIYGSRLIQLLTPQYIVFYNGAADRPPVEKLKPLGDYMTLINYIREYQLEGSKPRDAVDQAVQRCIAENILSVFLTKHRAEVMDVCITEFNEKAYADSIRKEGHAEGLVEGRTEGALQKGIQIYHNMRKRGFTKEDALSLADIPADAVKDDD